MSIPGQGVQEAFLTWWLRSQRLPPLLASLWPLPRQIGTFIIIILIIIILIIIIFLPRPTGTYIIQLVSIPRHLLQLGPPLPPWDTKNYHWDHPWEYPIKTYLLKLYHGPTIPPAGPCRPKAGFGLVSVNSCVWRRTKDIKYQGLKMRAQFSFSLSQHPESIILVGYFDR